MAEELDALLAPLQERAVHHHAGREFHTGRLDGHRVVLVLARVGKVACATTAAMLIERFGAERIVFTGVAGGLHPAARIGDVVGARELLQHDLDASPIFPRHEVPLYGRSRFASDAPLSDALLAAAREVLEIERFALAEPYAAMGIVEPRVHAGLVVSGDQFISTAPEGEALRRELPDAMAVEMEGAALAQVCHDCDVPFAVLRLVSDRADERAHVDFPRFLREIAGPVSSAIVRRWLSRESART